MHGAHQRRVVWFSVRPFDLRGLQRQNDRAPVPVLPHLPHAARGCEPTASRLGKSIASAGTLGGGQLASSERGWVAVADTVLPGRDGWCPPIQFTSYRASPAPPSHGQRIHGRVAGAGAGAAGGGDGGCGAAAHPNDVDVGADGGTRTNAWATEPTPVSRNDCGVLSAA